MTRNTHRMLAGRVTLGVSPSLSYNCCRMCKVVSTGYVSALLESYWVGGTTPVPGDYAACQSPARWHRQAKAATGNGAGVPGGRSGALPSELPSIANGRRSVMTKTVSEYGR